jgi:hypothetical protein
MNNQILKRAGVVLLPALVLVLASCASNKDEGTATEDITAIETPDGAIIVDTLTASAKVAAINEAKRKVTLEFGDGHKKTYKLGPEVVNFPQIQVGDTVTAQVTEEAAVYIGGGAPPSDMVGVGVALAPVGSKPGGEFVDTEQATARVVGVDAHHHKVTLQFADGTTRAVKVGKKVDLAGVRVGTDATIQLSEGIALSVAKPQ